MEERYDVEKLDEVMLPGFRFHPTDEELVGFYLKKKIQQRPLSIELIKQLDIYKFDPWDLPKMATTGEKEWYFYCPRDRKYRNSSRPNRVTGAGFWKATGTDRPIYSSEGSKCIGLKKSLVFYKGRAAKGIKTDWMMHEFRLPSLSDSAPQKRFFDKSIPANESWAICRIFKKNSSTTQRAISNSWVSPILPETTTSDMPTHSALTSQFSSDHNMFGYNNIDLPQSSSITTFFPLDIPSYKPINQMTIKPSEQIYFPNQDLPTSYDASTMLLNMSSSMFGDFGNKASESIDFSGFQDHCNGFSITLAEELQAQVGYGEETALVKDPNGASLYDHQWGTMKSVGFPFGLPLNLTDAWKSNFLWESSPCPSEMSTSFSTNKC